MADSHFNAFWTAYPRRIGKKAAQKAYQKAIKGFPRLPEAILIAIGIQKGWDAWKADNGKYIPHPATWLNGGRWEDEPTRFRGIEQPEPRCTADIRDLTEGDPAELTTRISKAWAELYGENPTTQTWELYEWVEVEKQAAIFLCSDDNVLLAYSIFLKDKLWASDRHPLSVFVINFWDYHAQGKAK